MRSNWGSCATIKYGGSGRSKLVEVVTPVQVEGLEIVVHIVRCGELDGVGRAKRSGRFDVGLEADWVDLRLSRTVHGDDLVADEVLPGALGELSD